jgi:hypothetical protein
MEGYVKRWEDVLGRRMSPWVQLVPNGLNRNAPYISYPALLALDLLPVVINNQG